MKLAFTLLGVATLMLTACNADQPTKKYDSTLYHPDTNTKAVDTVLKDSDFEKIQSTRGDIYNNRNFLINKIKKLNPTADFSGNYSEGSDKADDEFEAPDKYGSDFQIVGSKKHIKEFNYTYRPNDNYVNYQDFEFDIMAKMGKFFGKDIGEDFVALYLAAIKYSPDQAFKQSSDIGDLKFEIEYETENKTINFIVTHK